MFFGKGCKLTGMRSEPSIWTLQKARGVSRKKTGRNQQRDNDRVSAKRRRDEADADHRANRNNNRREVKDQK